MPSSFYRTVQVMAASDSRPENGHHRYFFYIVVTNAIAYECKQACKTTRSVKKECTKTHLEMELNQE